MTLPPLPANMRGLALDKRGYPVPFFVKWFDGVPDFRIIDYEKVYQCLHRHLCMICGQPFASGDQMWFAVGPLSAITRINDEPPMHLECCQFAAQTCPWMMRPGMKRIDSIPHPTGTITAADQEAVTGAINGPAPAVWALIAVDEFHAEVQSNRSLLFFMGEAQDVEWWHEGRRATRDEVEDGLADALVVIASKAPDASPEDRDELDGMYQSALMWLPEREG